MKTNWSTIKLGEVLELCDSGTWGDENPGGMPLLRSSNMQNGELILNDVKYIDVPANKVDRYVLHEGDILITKSSGSVDHIGKSLFITKEMDGKYGFSNFTQRLRMNRRLVLPKWIYLKISNPATRDFLFGASQTTTGLRNLKISALKELEISIPLITEQKKIVAKLEKLLAKINEAKRLRAEAQEATLSLLPAELHKIFEEGNPPAGEAGKKGWEEKEISSIVEKIQTVDPKKMPEEKFSYIDITSVSSNSEDTLRPRILSKYEAPSRARKLVQEGDTIFATTRPYLKNIAYIPKMLHGSVASTGFCVLRPKKKLIDSKYLFLIASSDPFIDEVSSFQKGATYPAVSDTVIHKIKIPLPPLAEQRKIVAHLDSLSEKVEKLKNYQLQTAVDLNALAQSVLQQAFGR